MPAKKLTVVISQAQGKNPVKRQLEEEIAAHLLMDPDVNVSLVPHLYDLDAAHTGTLFLKSVPGEMIVISWLYPRAAHWTLDRQGIQGKFAESQLKAIDEEDEESAADAPSSTESAAQPTGIRAVNVPDRRIYHIDLRVSSQPRDYIDEVKRIAREANVQTYDLMQWIGGQPQQAQLERYLHPERQLSLVNLQPPADAKFDKNAQAAASPAPAMKDNDDGTRRRWYPVIDYDRCTNCMECIDFCLFGVYGLDNQERILVEQQDNCKKGCPACSRVCPANAIIFPGHKTPSIAGADGDATGFKIDLSKLFGGGSDALEMAVQERDVELMRDGREAVGATVGMPKRQNAAANGPRDHLDDLMDSLDGLNL